MTDCKHTKTVEHMNGETYEVPHTSIFCPDCKKRIEPPGPTRPFKLKPHQR
jgi:hypothetical protein